VIKRVSAYQLRIIKEGEMKTNHFFNVVMATFIAVIFQCLRGAPPAAGAAAEVGRDR
jgi:hypothetical protein